MAYNEGVHCFLRFGSTTYYVPCIPYVPMMSRDTMLNLQTEFCKQGEPLQGPHKGATSCPDAKISYSGVFIILSSLHSALGLKYYACDGEHALHLYGECAINAVHLQRVAKLK